MFAEFEEWVDAKTVTMYSWGNDDVMVLLKEIANKEIKTGQLKLNMRSFKDFQSTIYKMTGQQYSLKNALKLFNMEFEGLEHNALYDALNLHRLYVKAQEQAEFLERLHFKYTVSSTLEQLYKICQIQLSFKKMISVYVGYYEELLRDINNLSINNIRKKIKDIRDEYDSMVLFIDEFLLGQYVAECSYMCSETRKQFKDKQGKDEANKDILIKKWMQILQKYRFALRKRGPNSTRLEFPLLKKFHTKIDRRIHSLSQMENPKVTNLLQQVNRIEKLCHEYNEECP